MRNGTLLDSTGKHTEIANRTEVYGRWCFKRERFASALDYDIGDNKI